MRTSDGQELLATTPKGIVEELRALSAQPTRSRAQFMLNAGSRASAQSGKPVRCDTPEHFVEDLLLAGLLLDE